MAKNCVGLDIGSNSIKAVQLKRSKGGFTLQSFDMMRLLPQTIVDGTIMDQAAVVDAIRGLWSRQRIRQKDVAIAIAGHSVIIKKIVLSPMTQAQLEDQLPFLVDDHIRLAKDDVEIDYDIITPQNASGQMEILLVAAKKEVVHDYANVVRDAGLNPVVVDVAAFTAQNAFEVNYDLNFGETAVLINIGAAISNINIIRDKKSLFTRDITIGGNAFTEEIQKQLSVSQDEAEAYKVGGSFDEHGVVPHEVERIIEGVAEVMAGEFQRSLDFFLATSADTDVSRICLSGGSAKVTALHRAIERRSRLNVEVVDAWKRIGVDPKLDHAYLGAHSPEALVGVGLALRAPNDKS